MKKLEISEEVNNNFHYLIEQLMTIYDEREATTIATYVLEDGFGLYNPLQSRRIFTIEEQVELEKITKELLTKRPWQYVLGEADFYDLKFKVNEAVLIPRSETEELVHFILQEHRNKALKVLDVGTGSGCIAISLQKNLTQARLTAVDVSKEALTVAKENAIKNAVTVEFQQLDILDLIATKKMPQYDVIVSNPPYIQDTEVTMMPDHVLKYEPHMALFVTNKDPLQFYKKITDFALTHLQTNGWLYFEINEYFGKEVLELLKQSGFVNCQLLPDMSNRDRIVLGQLPT